MSATVSQWMPLMPAALCALLMALVSDSMKQCLLLMILSTLNVVGVFLAWKFGWRVIELVLVMISGIVLSRTANGAFPRIPVLFVVVLMTMVGLWTLEKMDKERERERRGISASNSSSSSSSSSSGPQSAPTPTTAPSTKGPSTLLSPSSSPQSSSSGLLPPEILHLLFGSSSVRAATPPVGKSTGPLSPFIHPDRTWLSLLLHAFVQHAAPLKVPQFDIGGKLPLFSTRYFQRLNAKQVREGTHLMTNPVVVKNENGAQSGEKQLKNSGGGIVESLWNAFTFAKDSDAEASPSMSQAFSDYDDAQKTSHIGPTGGFHAIVDFAYSADENTKIEVEIPMQVPLWGTLAVPVMVTSPELAGALVLEFRHDVIENVEEIEEEVVINGIGPNSRKKLKKKEVVSHSKVMAMSFMFEPIREIHIHGIHISLASQFQLIQYIPIVKRYMKQAVNHALLPEVRRVMIFDSSFTTLASFQLAKDEIWNIPGLLERAKQEAIEQGMDPHTVSMMKHPHVDDMPPASTSTTNGASNEAASNSNSGVPRHGAASSFGDKDSGFSFPILDLSDPTLLKDVSQEIPIPLMPDASSSPTGGVAPSSRSPSSSGYNFGFAKARPSETVLERFIQTTEVDADLPLSLQPGNAREAGAGDFLAPAPSGSNPSQYPKLNL